MSKKSNTFILGVFILMISNLLVKAIGIFFKIPLQNLIGDVGMGYFNIAYNVYSYLYIVSTAGLPVAVSVLVSSYNAIGMGKMTDKIFKITLRLFAVIGFIGCAVMMIFCRPIADAVGMTSSYICIFTVAPTLLFICITSAVRGYYQGFENMTVTGISQLIEALGKVGIGIALAYYSVSNGDPLYITAAYAISGITVGTLISMLFSVLFKYFRPPTLNLTSSDTVSDKTVLSKLLKIAIPVTVSSSVIGLTNFIDAATVAQRLQAIGYTETQAAEIYGNYTTLAVSLFNMPTVLIYPIACAVVPALSAAISSKNTRGARSVINSSYKLVCLIALPAAIGMGVLSEDILCLLFNDASSALASPMLSLLACSIFFCGIISLTNGILQAEGHEKLPIISMVIGASVKLILSYILLSIPQIGRYGIPISTGVCYFTISVINIIFSSKVSRVFPNVMQTFVKPLISATVCGFVGHYVQLFLSSRTDSDATVLVSIACAAAVYLLCILILRAFDENDLLLLPKGEKAVKIFKKLKLLK